MKRRIVQGFSAILVLAAAAAPRAAAQAERFPAPVVVTFDTIRPNDTERATKDPVLRVFSDGRILVIDPWDRDEKPAEVTLKPERMLRLMEALTADLRFMEVGEKQIRDGIAAEQHRRRTPVPPERAAVTVVSIHWAGQSNTVAYPALDFYTEHFRRVQPLQQFQTVCTLLWTLRLETLAGGHQIVRAALKEINERLAGESGKKDDTKDKSEPRIRTSKRPSRRASIRMKTTDLVHVRRRMRVREDLTRIPVESLTRKQRRALPEELRNSKLVGLIPEEKLGERPINTLIFQKIVEGRRVLRVEARAEVDAGTGEVISTAIAMTQPF